MCEKLEHEANGSTGGFRNWGLDYFEAPTQLLLLSTDLIFLS